MAATHLYGTVETVTWLSPSMVRIVPGGPGLDARLLAEQALDA